MKRKYFIILIFISLSGTYTDCPAQAGQPLLCCRPLPKMFVNKKDGDSRRLQFKSGWFLNKSKYKRLQKLNGSQDLSIFYTYNAFDSLITKFETMPGYSGIRIYLARYNICNMQTSAPYVDVKPNQLILLFSPEDSFEVKREYYFIKDNDDLNYKVLSACAQEWIDNYDSIDMPSLRKTISKRDDDNYYDGIGNKKIFSDTKSIFYKREDVHDAFIVEKYFQSSNHKIDIVKYRVSFSSYNKKGKTPTNDDLHTYKRRLFIQFDFMKSDFAGSNEVFYLDDQDDYYCRLSCTLNSIQLMNNIRKVQFKMNTVKNLNSVMKFVLPYLDNGQLCPTYCK